MNKLLIISNNVFNKNYCNNLSFKNTVYTNEYSNSLTDTSNSILKIKCVDQVSKLSKLNMRFYNIISKFHELTMIETTILSILKDNDKIIKDIKENCDKFPTPSQILLLEKDYFDYDNSFIIEIKKLSIKLENNKSKRNKLELKYFENYKKCHDVIKKLSSDDKSYIKNEYPERKELFDVDHL